MTVMDAANLEVTDLQAIAEQVWTSYLGDTEPLLPSFGPLDDAFAQGMVWSAAVSVHGGWLGTVTVEVASTVAEQLTRTMLALEATALTDADIADAVGELVNMIGGNVKSLMPGPSTLTLPVVAAGRTASPSAAAELARFDATYAGRPVRVTVRADHR